MARKAVLIGLAMVLGLVGLGPAAAEQSRIASLAANKPSPQPAYTNITFTATGTGGTAPYSYRWWISWDGGETWEVTRDWSPANTFLWGPDSEQYDYQIAVGIRSAGNPSDVYEDKRVMSFTILSACLRTEDTPPDQDVDRGQCLFDSPILFGQANPNNLFASCGGCHPGGATDQASHLILLANRQGQKVVPRQTPDLRNVTINLPLGWDGRHGGRRGDLESIKAAIRSAASGAITSPVEMAGRFEPGDPADRDKMDSLVAFLLSLSPTQPRVPTPEDPPQPPMLDDSTRENIKIGADVFFGRSASTRGLLAQGKACVSCHPPPAFTDNQVRTNVLNPAAAFDFGFPTGPYDTGAAFITGDPGLTGFFKTPSLHFFYPTGFPFMHNGIITNNLTEFYQLSLGFSLGPEEDTGLHYWLVNCPQGIERAEAEIPPECN